MLFGDKETDFIQSFQDIDDSEVFFPFESDVAIDIYQKIHSKEKWSKWIDSSGKSDPPPDFYSNDYKLMMDVMRVNDHEHKGKKGKLYNPSMSHEKQMLRELEEAGVLKQFPNAKVYLNGDTQLPTYEDHNYDLYLKCFCRVIKKHIESIPLYKKNHPGCKVLFFVFDESSAYFESSSSIDRQEECVENHIYSGIPHLFFEDEAFLEVFIDKGIDFLLWFAPYKRFENLDPPIELPKLCVYDLSIDGFRKTKYDENRMVSVER